MSVDASVRSAPRAASDLFVDFRARWILYEDSHVIAVDKPAGMPSQSARPDRPDDVVHRLRAFLSRRDGVQEEDVYLGTHQRLDARASGVMIFARTREANPSLARQFEGRRTEKEYLVGVTDFSLGRGEHRLEHFLRREGPRMVALDASGERPPADRGRRLVPSAESTRHRHARSRGQGKTQRAVLVAEEVARRDERSLLRVRLETGRMHQIRAQLAAIGSRVAGDELYGGASAPRLLLHARALRLEHPITGQPLSIESETPIELLEHVGENDATRDPAGEIQSLLERAAHRRFAFGHPEGRPESNAYRLLNSDGDGADGVVVDVYGQHVVVAVEEGFSEKATTLFVDALDAAGYAGVYLKRRPTNPSRVTDERLSVLAPAEPVRGVAASDPLEVQEHGIPYLVHLSAGLSTGLFLDQRDNRSRLREHAAGKSILNLFSYTGAFTIAAARGGATVSLTIDASARALAWAEEGFAHASLDRNQHRLRRGEVFDELDRLAKRGESFDIVVLDPPTFSTVGARRWSSGRGYRELAGKALRVTGRSGILIACSNDSRMSASELRRHLQAGADAVGRRIERMKDYPPPLDFPPARKGVPALKTVWVQC